MIFVVGQPRTGTSLTMQMLAAAGFDCMGLPPAYETEYFRMRPYNWRGTQGRRSTAAKILWDGPADFPVQHHYILTSRANQLERARSEIKFLQAVGIPAEENATTVARFIAGAEHHERDIWRAFRGRRVLRVTFEELIEESAAAAARIASFIGRGDVDLMAGVVRPRTVACYDGMLELDLLNEEKSREEPQRPIRPAAAE